MEYLIVSLVAIDGQCDSVTTPTMTEGYLDGNWINMMTTCRYTCAAIPFIYKHQPPTNSCMFLV